MNRRILIGTIIVVMVVGYLFWSGMKDSAVYFHTVGEFFDRQEELAGKGTRVNGDLVPDSIKFDAENLILTFQITDGAKVLNVRYHGVAPDTFSEAVSVVVAGKYVDGVFQATQLMTKCPSKYEAKKN
ncbi:MAG: cytochrome c maturation protein CcmE [Calditrichaeota bacterium]|nr:cytochrome c maturation protein CcmE [Calditrichota bacterium]